MIGISYPLFRLCSLHSEPESSTVSTNLLKQMISTYIDQNNLRDKKGFIEMNDVLLATTKLDKQPHKSTINFESLMALIQKNHVTEK